MCLLLLGVAAHPDYPLVVAANRDEWFYRPAQAAHWWPDHPDLLAGRDEQASKEEGELAVLEEFMPAPLSEEELERIVDDAIAEVKATSMRDMGRVMADVMPQIAGRADGSAVSQLVREKLA